MIKRLYAQLNRLQRGGYNAETLTGAKTMDHNDALLHRLDPGGASRNVTLTAEESSKGKMFRFVNTADAAENLVILDDAAATVCTVGPGETGEVVCNGTTWTAVVYDTSGINEAVVATTVAAAGADQSGATAMTAALNVVTGADGAKGVALPAAAVGYGTVLVYNSDASGNLLVYPASGDDINDNTANVHVLLAGKSIGLFVALDAATWAFIETVDRRSAETVAGAKTLSALLTLTGGLAITTADATITDRNLIGSATTGTKIGTAATQKWGFWNATPVVQPLHVADPAAMAALTSAALTENGGAIGGSNDGDAPTPVDPNGDAGASVIAYLRELAVALNEVRADVAAAKTAIDANKAAVDAINAFCATIGITAAS